MKNIVLTSATFILAVIFCHSLFAQKFITEKSNIRFFSSAPLEDIEATTTTSRSVFDSKTGDIAFSVRIQDFEFDKSLMKEHFNEKYMESEKFPKATFKGKLVDFVSSSNNQDVVAEGELNIHGVTKNVKIPGTVKQSNDLLHMHSVFKIKLEDHDVKIPSILFQNIAEVVEVTVDFEFKPYEN